MAGHAAPIPNITIIAASTSTITTNAIAITTIITHIENQLHGTSNEHSRTYSRRLCILGIIIIVIIIYDYVYSYRLVKKLVAKRAVCLTHLI